MPITGENIHYRLNVDNPVLFDHFQHQTNKFTQRHNNQVKFMAGNEIHRDNLEWRENKYVIPMILFCHFLQFSVK